jgi:hypothetical protein
VEQHADVYFQRKSKQTLFMKISSFKSYLVVGLSIVLFSANALAQSELLSFSESRTVSGVSDSELFLRAKKSLNTSFLKSNLELLEVEETANSSIKGKSSVDFATKDGQLRTVASGSVSFEFMVNISDGKAELILTNWVHQPNNRKYDFGEVTTDAECPKKVGGTMKKSRNNVWTDLRTTAEETSATLLKNFVESLGEKAEGNVQLTSQTITDGLPADIKTAGVIFLKHQLAEVEAAPDANNSERLRNKNKEQHNQMAPSANEKLNKAAADYPYKYVIASNRAELEKLQKEGYKYGLDCMAYDNMKNGNFKSSAQVEYFYELYVRDLSDNTRYIITSKLSERSVYNFNLMIGKHLMKAIEKGDE